MFVFIFIIGFALKSVPDQIILEDGSVILRPSAIKRINSELSYEDFIEKSILINNQVIDATKSKEDLLLLESSTQNYFLLQFIGPVKEEWKSTLELLGVEFFDYVPEFSYKIWLPKKQIPEVLKLDFISNLVEYTSELKLSAPTATKINLMAEEEEINLFLETFKSNDEIANNIFQSNAMVVQESENSFLIKVKKSELKKILSYEDINVIEELKPISVVNDYAVGIMDVDTTSARLNINGSGQILGIIDSGVDDGDDDLNVEGDIHLDLDNRLVNISLVANAYCQLYGASCTDPDDQNGHGTHTVGSMAGNGTRSSNQYKGISYASDITFYAAGDDSGSTAIYPFPLDTMLQNMYNDGARIQSNSWGSGTTEYSNALAKKIDKFMRDNNDLLIVVSAGNDGSSLQTVRDPGTAKNCLTVGATQSNRSGSGYGTNVNTIASFSSRGPANDNRTKPDVVAPGTNIVSTKSSLASTSCTSSVGEGGYYSTCSGTSMSAPLVAGYVSLIRENFIENLDISNPTAALLKALIINGAQDIGYGIPSNHTGWGRVNLTNSLIPSYPKYFKFIDNKTGFSSSGQYDIHTFNVINDTSDFKITLVWTDEESSSSASKNLVNDLDLVVTSPNGTKYYGNNFVWPYNSSQDRINNVEQLILDSSTGEVENGTYSINVSAFLISNANQDYGLVVSGPLNVSPIVTQFDGDTSDFGTMQHLYNKTNLVLEDSNNGNITWNDNVYVADVNFDSNLIIANNNLWINQSGLHSSLASNVTVGFFNLDFEAPMPYKDGVHCSDCEIVDSSSGNLEFYTFVSLDVASNYSSVENTSFVIWDALDAGKPYGGIAKKNQNEEVYFYANYTNYSSSLSVSTATCNISFNDSSSLFTMNYNSSITYYQYNRTFSSAGDYSYNITCVASNFLNQSSNNNTTVSDINAVYPQEPTSLGIVLNGNNSITLSWSAAVNASTYGVFYDDNVTLLWEFNEDDVPNITGITELNYTDNSLGSVTQRYYKLVSQNSTSRQNASNITLGIFKKEIPITTATPNTGVEQILVSVPLNVTNLNLDSLISSSSDADVIYNYDTQNALPQSSQYFDGFGWFGGIEIFEINKGYIFKPISTAFNISFVGFVPITNSTITLKSSTNMAGNATELNVIGLNTPQTKCDLDTIFYNATSGDSIYRYNYVSAEYDVASYNGVVWSGDFDCINPGEGYEMRVVTNNYVLNYER